MYGVKDVQAKFRAGEQLEYIFFWGHQKTLNGTVTKTCLSQWYQEPFEMNNFTYQCAEQYMMAEKARIFKDEEALDKILKAYHPNQMKLIGKNIKNFDLKIWNEVKFDIVKIANLGKFSQNYKLKKYLRSTKNKILVQASPHDKVWGIGFSENDCLSQNPLYWNGENLLGFVLMNVREILL
ncbi:swarming motility protein YbiA [Clostridium saccharobutylicum]|uniref:NADAR family protein n=1 Tax=Clostridium saccharobutylicum TaxID=169679 RepID=UPI000983E6E8|nr:NADAR family protein [Clostridium saccharobutylicum]AQS10444.1 swarming motility protein YbiA [Clostridium saccharobutylicum]MBC2437840.1 NADAR family protein [Clostridium saccharobutylicum]NSB90267.1 hypothetical protein [Clostridium saccharobutylicum]OOM16774.1 swarming motility protein YbiA [Clostridium saccharobutylicum]